MAQQSQVLMAYQETYHRMDLLETLRSTWVSLGKSSPIFKFKYGPSCFLKVFVVIFDFEVGVPGCNLVNLCQISSLSMADHVF